MTMSRRSVLGAAAMLPALAPALAGTGDQGAPDTALFELRQYTLRRNQRDVLATMFERYFVQPQEDVGAHVLGTFRDLNDPDRFVWMREFANLEARKNALERFYYGPVWKEHRTAANATILDSDNVLLLRRVPLLAGPHGDWSSGGEIEAAIYYLGAVDTSAFLGFFDEHVEPLLAARGSRPLLRFATADVANNFPRLPVRGDRVFVRFSTRSSKSDLLPAGWRDAAPEAILPAFMRKPERLHLAPLLHPRAPV
ncbi:MAG: NIPSNAP family protein [Proteobacteria bacterium]|nr:NIPSNAP family protein [Pseudomonadota bacterium]